MQTWRRASRVVVLASALAAAAAACGPKGDGRSGVPPTPSPSPTPPPWGAEARQMIEMGLAGPRLLWNEPAIRPGERIRWVITSRAFADRFLDVALALDPAGAERWTLIAGHPSAPRRTLVVSRSAGRVVALEMSGKDLPASDVRDPAFLSDIVPAALAGTAGEASFSAGGGSFLGNEVVRVPAGEYRARHGVIADAKDTWHLYAVRQVPGGLVKVERFPGGAFEPTLVMEVDELTRLPKAPAN